MYSRESGHKISSAFRIIRRTTGTARLLKSFSIFQFLAFLDLIGVFVFGYIGSLVLNGINPNLQIDYFDFISSILRLDSLRLQTKVLVLTFSAVVLLLLRSVASLYFTRRNLMFLSRKAAQISGKLIKGVLEGSSAKSSNIGTELYRVTTGVQQLYTNVVGNLLAALADISLSLTFIIGVMYVDFLTSVVVAISFTLFVFTLNIFLSERIRRNGRAIGDLSRQSSQEVIDTVALYREIRLRGVVEEFSDRIGDVRNRLADVLVPNQIYGILNKYLMEGFILVLLTSVAGLLFFIYDANTGFAKLAIFFVASSRIAPALMRMQVSIFNAKSHLEQASATLEAIEDLNRESDLKLNVKEGTNPRISLASPPTIKIKDLRYRHAADLSGKNNWILEVDDLEVAPGQVLAITGKSGSGKTTLVDLILGFKSPESGSITFNGGDAKDVRRNYSGYFGYVPQEVYLTNDSIRENIKLRDKELVGGDEVIWHVLELVELRDWVESLPQKLDSVLGVGQISPSGGQRQRLGLARCLISEPKVIVLDEVTSGLDAATEKDLIIRMRRIPWENTQIWISHRDVVKEISNLELIVKDNGRTEVHGKNINHQITNSI